MEGGEEIAARSGMRQAPDFDGETYVKKDGSVWRWTGKRFVAKKAWVSHGTCWVRTRWDRVDGKRVSRTAAVGSLVLRAFGVPRPIGCTPLNFPDPDPWNNALDNLRWAPRGTKAIGRKAGGRRGSALWKSHAKLDEEKVRRAQMLYEHGQRVHEIAEDLGVCRAAINHALTGRTWKHLYRPLAKQGPACGSFNARAIIDELQAEEIREMAADGKRPCEIAKATGIGYSTVLNVVKCKSWKHMEGAAPIEVGHARGSQAGLAKLIESDVAAIKAALACGEKGIDLARHYGVDATVISRIKLGKAWKHVASLVSE